VMCQGWTQLRENGGNSTPMAAFQKHLHSRPGEPYWYVIPKEQVNVWFQMVGKVRDNTRPYKVTPPEGSQKNKTPFFRFLLNDTEEMTTCFPRHEQLTTTDCKPSVLCPDVQWTQWRWQVVCTNLHQSHPQSPEPLLTQTFKPWLPWFITHSRKTSQQTIYSLIWR
jgi:hypothetical protein